MQVGEAIAAGPGAADDTSDPDAVLRITDVRGLYSPGFDDGAESRRIGCGDRPGYISQDDRGRVFINHRPRTDPSEGWNVRVRDTQYIELTVTVRPTGGPLPADAKIRWTWSAPDDPSDTGMHAAAAQELDGNQDQGGDNRGCCDFPSPNGGEPVYEKIAPYLVTNAQAKQCETPVVNDKSRVRLHLTNVGGDAYRVKAELIGTAGAVAETGTMTMWKRIDVAYYKMAGDIPDLPVNEAARKFEICFVQLDFTSPRKIDHQEALASGMEWNVPARQLIDDVFEEAGQPGWFCLIAADIETTALSVTPVTTVYNGPARIVAHTFSDGTQSEWLAVTTAQAIAPNPTASYAPTLADANAADIGDGSVEPQFFTMHSMISDWPQAGLTSFMLDGLDYLADFNAGDGSHSVAYVQKTRMYPTQTEAPNGQWSPGGLGLGTQVTAKITAGEGVGARGISPTLTHNGRHYFGGRTIVFTGRFRMVHGGPMRALPFDRARALRTIVHELTHAFGLPHACGYHSYDDPADASCAMVILDRWLFKPGTREIQRDHPGRLVPHLCARHIIGVRETHLEDNPAIWAWP